MPGTRIFSVLYRNTLFSGSATHITRVYDSSSAGGKGAFVTSVASLTSFILAPSYFYTRNANDSIEVICTSLVCSAIYIDDNDKLDITSSDVISVDGVSYFSMSYVVPNPVCPLPFDSEQPFLRECTSSPIRTRQLPVDTPIM